jgi:hypothetical protein
MAFLAIKVDCLCLSFAVIFGFFFVCILRFFHGFEGFDS